MDLIALIGFMHSTPVIGWSTSNSAASPRIAALLAPGTTVSWPQAYDLPMLLLADGQWVSFECSIDRTSRAIDDA